MFSDIEAKAGSDECLAKSAAVHEAVRHIFDNDTSGAIRSKWNDGARPMRAVY